jgi:uncharacterized metal-binding protein YceD (DUF177 family)
MTDSKPLWSRRLALDEVPEGGLHVDLAADAATRAALAQAAGLRDLPRLEAALDVSRHGRAGLRVEGEMSATVGQTCVVSLEPIEQEIREPIDLVFASSPGPAALADDKGEATMRFGDAEPPELLAGGEVDLGAIVAEFLMLSIDPYPRKEGVQFDAPPRQEEGAGPKPFAALAALRKGKGGGEG